MFHALCFVAFDGREHKRFFFCGKFCPQLRNCGKEEFGGVSLERIYNHLRNLRTSQPPAPIPTGRHPAGSHGQAWKLPRLRKGFTTAAATAGPAAYATDPRPAHQRRHHACVLMRNSRIRTDVRAGRNPLSRCRHASGTITDARADTWERSPRHECHRARVA